MGERSALVRVIPKSVPQVKRALEVLEQDLNAAKTYDEIRQIERMAEAIKLLHREVDEIRQQAETVIIMANHRIGIELAAAPVATAGRPSKNRHSENANFPSLEEQVGSKNRGLRLKKLASIPETEVKEAITKLHHEGMEATVNRIIRDVIGGKTRADNAVKAAARMALPDGKFDVIVMDPPWPMQKIVREVRPNQVAFDYPVMTEEELLAYASELEPRIAENCHFFLWTTHKFLPMAFRLLEAWDLGYVCTFVWHKPGGFQPVGMPQLNCEFALYARRGTPKFIDTKGFFCCFEAARREHSRKPDFFYEMIARVTEGRRVEWFAREARAGFDAIGNETAKFAEAAAE